MPFGANMAADVISKERKIIQFRPQIGGVKPPAGMKDMFIKLAHKGTRKFKDRLEGLNDPTLISEPLLLAQGKRSQHHSPQVRAVLIQPMKSELPPIFHSRSVSRAKPKSMVPSTEGWTGNQQHSYDEKRPGEAKLPKIAGYLQRERVKRFGDVTKKMTWDTIQRMDATELEGVTNQAEFDPRDLLGIQSSEDMQFVKQVVGRANPRIFPDRTARKIAGDRSASIDRNAVKGPYIKWSTTPSELTSELQQTRRGYAHSNPRAAK